MEINKELSVSVKMVSLTEALQYFLSSRVLINFLKNTYIVKRILN